MTLDTYLKLKRISQTEFARRLGVAPQRISYINSNGRSPGRVLAIKIEDATDGLVSIRSWDEQEDPTE